MSWNKICVIAATNSTTADGQAIDYVQQASIAAERVKHYLDVPVFLLTRDRAIKSDVMKSFNGHMTIIPSKSSKRNMIAGQETIQYEWHNDLRISSYHIIKHHHPYAEKVLMIDADYMVASDMLKPWLESDSDFHIFDKVSDVTGRDSYSNLFPSNDITQRWATAICWKPGDIAYAIFKTAAMVRHNYAFYALMLGMPQTPFRNDVAFSIACHLHNVPGSNLPTRLYNLPPDSDLFLKSQDLDSGREVWTIQNGNRINFWTTDLHVLNKSYAIDPELMDELRLRDVSA